MTRDEALKQLVSNAPLVLCASAMMEVLDAFAATVRRETLEDAAKDAEAHGCDIIAQGKPDPVIDSYVDGVLAGYRDAVQQIVESIRALQEAEG